jgi:hypothetical protein
VASSLNWDDLSDTPPALPPAPSDSADPDADAIIAKMNAEVAAGKSEDQILAGEVSDFGRKGREATAQTDAKPSKSKDLSWDDLSFVQPHPMDSDITAQKVGYPQFENYAGDVYNSPNAALAAPDTMRAPTLAEQFRAHPLDTTGDYLSNLGKATVGGLREAGAGIERMAGEAPTNISNASNAIGAGLERAYGFGDGIAPEASQPPDNELTLIGTEQHAKGAAEQEQASGHLIQPPQEGDSFVSKVPFYLQSTAESAPQLAAGPATFAGLAAGSTYGEQRARGVAPGQSMEDASIDAVANYATTKLMLDAAAGKEAVTGVAGMAKATGAGATSNLALEAAKIWREKYVDGQDISAEDVKQRLLDATQSGTVMGATIHTATAPFRSTDHAAEAQRLADQTAINEGADIAQKAGDATGMSDAIESAKAAADAAPTEESANATETGQEEHRQEHPGDAQGGVSAEARGGGSDAAGREAAPEVDEEAAHAHAAARAEALINVGKRELTDAEREEWQFLESRPDASQIAEAYGLKPKEASNVDTNTVRSSSEAAGREEAQAAPESLHPDERNIQKAHALAESIKGLSDEQKAAIVAGYPKPAKDPLTGYDTRPELVPTIAAAASHAAAGTPAFYAEVDFRGLHPLNEHMGGQAGADVHMKQVVDAFARAELEAAGAEVAPNKKGGDEFGFTGTGIDAATAHDALVRAQQKAVDYLRAQGVGRVFNNRTGEHVETGIHFAATDIRPSDTAESVLGATDAALARRKRGAPYERPGTDQTTGTGRGAGGRPTGSPEAAGVEDSGGTGFARDTAQAETSRTEKTENVGAPKYSRAEQSQVSIDDELEPRSVIEIHGPKDKAKLASLVEDMNEHGWRGRPILVYADASGATHALTGSHRLAAAKKAGITVPVHYVSDEAIGHEDVRGDYLQDVAGSGDDRVADFLRDAGDEDSARLVEQEDALAKYSRTEPGERDLIVQHNLSAENLMHAQRMGGIPVPSLAVTKVHQPIHGFGEISLIGDKEMANPRGYARSRVHGADIYSPRYPEVQFKVDKDVVRKMREALGPDSPKYYDSYLKPRDLTSEPSFKEYAKRIGADKGDFASLKQTAEKLLRDSGATEHIFQGFTYSWKRRYVAHSLDNVVKILKKELRGGEGFNYGVGSLRAHFTPQFRSVEQIRANRERLVSKENFEKVKEEVDKDFFSIVNDIHTESGGNDRDFGYADRVIGLMGDIPRLGFDRALKDYGMRASDETRQKIGAFLTHLRNMPTEYFEAKILRDVDIAEFRGAAVPHDVEPHVIDTLKARGVDVEKYKRGDEADRARAIKAIADRRDDVLFSKSEAGSRGVTEPEARATLEQAFGKAATRKLESAGLKLTSGEALGNLAPDLSPNQRAGVKGLTTSKGEPHVIHDQTPAADLPGVAVHEVWHANADRVLSPGQQAGIARRVEKLAERSPAVREALDKIPEGERTDGEKVAYALQHLQNQSLGRRVMDSIKLGLNRLGVPLDWLNAHEAAVREIGQRNLRHFAEGEQTYQTAANGREKATQFSREEPKEPGNQYSAGQFNPIAARAALARGSTGNKPTTTLQSAPSDRTRGVKNEYKAQERTERGLQPLDAEGKRDFGAVWDAATAKRQEDPGAGARLAADVANDPRPLRAEETALLVQHGAELNNRYDKALADIDAARASGDTRGEVDAQLHRRELEDLLQIHDIAARQSGYEQGLGLAMRRAMAKQDYSLARQMARFKAIEGGEVPAEVRARVEGYVKQIADLTRERDAALAAQTTSGTSARKRGTQRTAKVIDDELSELLSELDKISSKPEAKPEVQFSREDDVTALVRKVAKNRVEAGIDDAVKLVDTVHSLVGAKTGMDKEKIADTISGYGAVRKRTKNELMQRYNALRAEMRDLSKTHDIMSGEVDQDATAKRARASSLRNQITDIERQLAHGATEKGKREPLSTPEIEALKKRREVLSKELLQNTNPPQAIYPRDLMGQKNATRQKAIIKELADIKSRIQRGDFDKAKRSAPVYNERTNELQAQLNSARNKLDILARQRERMQSGRVARTADLIHNIHMGAILSSIHVYPKLGAAVLARWVGTPLEEAVGSAVRHIPGISRVAAMAPRHGAGFTLAAESEALRGIGKGAKGAIEQLRYGETQLDKLHGGKAHLSGEFTDFMGQLADAIGPIEKARVFAGFPGRTHAAVKELASQPEFYRSYLLRGNHMRDQMAAAGKSAAEIDAFMERPSTQAALGAKAYEDALEAKMQGKNAFADSVNTFVNHLEKNGGVGGKSLAFVFKTLFPIRKVPINIVKELTSYSAGGIKAAVASMHGELTPERADYIMKNIKKQGAGAVLFALGYLGGQAMFGGVPGTDKKKGLIKPDEAKISGVDIGSYAFHGPATQMLQLGAGFRKLFEKEYGASHGAITAGLDALGSNYGNLMVRNIPYLEQPRRMYNTYQWGRNSTFANRGHGAGEVLGGQLRSMLVPQLLQQAAAASDTYKGFRHPKNILEDIELGIPGFRENVSTQKPN